MRQHAVPQNIMSVEFKLFGEMTVRQFMYVAGAGLLAWIVYLTPLPSFIVLPIDILIVILGLASAFVPINELRFDEWITNYIIAVIRPTRRIWRQSSFSPEFEADKALIKAFDMTKLNTEMETLPEGSQEGLKVSVIENEAVDKLEKAKIDAVDYARRVIDQTMSGVGANAPTNDLLKVATAIATKDAAIFDSNPVTPIIPTSDKPTSKKEETPVINNIPAPVEDNNNGIQISKESPAKVDEVKVVEPILSAPVIQEVPEPNMATVLPQAKVEDTPITNNKESSIPSGGTVFTPTVTNTQLNNPVSPVLPAKEPVLQDGGQDAKALVSEIVNKIDDKSSEANNNLNVQIKQEAQNKMQRIQDIMEQEKAIKSSLTSLSQTPNAGANSQNQSGLLEKMTSLEDENKKLMSQLEALQQQLEDKPEVVNTSVPNSDLQKYAPLPSFVSQPDIISGIVVDKDGKVIPDVVIIVKDEMFKPVRAMHTNILGQFFTRGPLDQGKYKLELHKENLLFKRLGVELKGEVVAPLLVRAISREDMLTLTEGVPFNVFNSATIS